MAAHPQWNQWGGVSGIDNRISPGPESPAEVCRQLWSRCPRRHFAANAIDYQHERYGPGAPRFLLSDHDAGLGAARGHRTRSERALGRAGVHRQHWIGGTEAESEAGLSHLLEHMLFRGTGTYNSEELNQIFDGMGADINASTDEEHTLLYVRALDTDPPEVVELMSGMIWRPRFYDLETERQVVLEEIAMYEDDPQDRASEMSNAAVFGSHPLGRPVIGTAEVVGSVTREQLLAFHAERYQPENIVVSAAGSLGHDDLVEMAAEAWGRGARLRRLAEGDV